MSIYRKGPAPTNSCPRCLETLVRASAPGAEGVAFCEKCGGVFADVAATARIVSTMDRALQEIGFLVALGKERKQHEPRELTCPECLIAMQRQRIESAACTVDVCPAHGTWFDTGELEDVMRAFNRARRHGARPPGVVPEAHNPSMVVIRTAPPTRDETLAEMVLSFFR
jgi:Zn-finger nucleic acid-binding protein